MKVLFVDYGNECEISLNKLRKDLVCIERPRCSIPTILYGIETFPNIKVEQLHEFFYDKNVRVQLMEPPTQIPLKVKIFVDGMDQDLATFLVNNNMAIYEN